MEVLWYMACCIGVFFLSAYILLLGYTWFLVPAGAPVLNLWQLWGIAMVVVYATQVPDVSLNKKDKRKGWELLSFLVGYHLTALLMMWLVSIIAY